ncbi:hypothetical protein CYMTET_11367 [Cymbomonas tetramitiformis]|uniref:Uncharacterized protein n=1 Tax=Cymbomonas tetramitiformis TaxID=36881 RepID=A0AAE0GMA8_9CHLO|nr:hypothetical protein CYMTET_11367 [Cymbomonas tetramitiformis]
MASTALNASLFAHFFPKFDNQKEDTRITPGLERAMREVASTGEILLAVTKKHSGSLVMAPPFYSKNGCGNMYSRMASVVLYEHFKAVWEDEYSEKWDEWWEDSMKHGLCYSFECVVPRVLGDHGSTPRGAFAILTCIASTPDERFLSPCEMLQLATKWRLPLNEAWFLPVSCAQEVEDALHEMRWSAGDREVTARLDELGFGHRFLSHTQVQGNVLEGVVLLGLHLEGRIGELEQLVDEYHAAMHGHRERALAAALALGERCLSEDPELLSMLESPIPGISEPVRQEMTAEAAWELACDNVAPGRVRTALQRCRDSYKHFVNLKVYKWAGDWQVQVHVTDDQVFYGWPLHMQDGSTAALYRGMVIRLAKQAAPNPTPVQFVNCPSARVLSIAKLKCLNYIFRTFAVRNQLRILLEQGASAYSNRLKAGFFKTWGVPALHAQRLAELLSRWGNFVDNASPSVRKDLGNGRYLATLESFLEGKHEGQGGAERNVFQGCAVIVCNLSGQELDSKYIREYLEPNGLTPGPRVGIPCTYVILDHPPAAANFALSPSTAGSYRVLVVPPGPDADPKWQSMADNVKGRKWEPHVMMLYDPTAEDWARKQHVVVKPRRTVVAVVALPPGGGKSTLFAALADLGASVAASDAFKDRQKFEKAFDRALASTRSGVVCYDKNIPNMAGLGRLLKVLQARDVALQYDVRVALVAPQFLDEAVMWQRVISRPSTHIGMTAKAGEEEALLEIFNKCFMSESRQFLHSAQKAPGVVISEAFFSLSEGDTLRLAERLMHSCQVAPEADEAKEAEEAAAAGVPIEDLALWFDGEAPEEGSAGHAESREGARDRPRSWCSLELTGTGLHVTLVPPAGSSADAAAEKQRQEAVARLAQRGEGHPLTVRATRYHRARFPGQGSGEKSGSAAFWEVDEIEGLEDDEHFPPQQAFYHITDKAALTRGMPAKVARDVMEQLKTARALEETQTSDSLQKSAASAPSDVISEIHPFIFEGKLKIN